jgi:hypothetical protein
VTAFADMIALCACMYCKLLLSLYLDDEQAGAEQGSGSDDDDNSGGDDNVSYFNRRISCYTFCHFVVLEGALRSLLSVNTILLLHVLHDWRSCYVTIK